MEAQRDGDRRPMLGVVVGTAVALVSLPLAAAAGPPYLELARVSPWVVGFAIGSFAALFAAPFAIHRALGGTLEADARWERALLLWSLVAIAALAIGLLCGVPSGFAADSLAGAVGLVLIVEAVLILGTLGAWLLSS
jgi:hypothetical protein